MRSHRLRRAVKAGLLATAAMAAMIQGPASAGTISYQYDILGRVTLVVNSDGSSVSYQYDLAGNRTQIVRAPPAPVASAATINTAYNTAGSTSLSISGTYTSTSVVTAASHGTGSVSGATASYTPTSGYYGADSFTYKATGPGGSSPPATITVNVAKPAAPTAGTVSFSTAYNTAGSVNLAPSGVYTSLGIAASPSHGSASISGATATYTPGSNYIGSDSFTYTATGPGGSSSAATVSVTVNAPAAPTVGNVSLSSSYNGSGTATLAPSGIYSSLALASNPSHGSASISGTTATYTPSSNYIGSDSFTYTATGPGGTSSAATVSVTVNAPAAPTVGNVSLTANYNTAGTATLSPGGNYSSFAVASGPSHGSASISGTAATYTPSNGYIGADSFTYTATGPGGTSSAATVSVTVNAPPAPTVGNASLSSSYNGSGSVGLSPIGVYSSLALASNPSHGSASISGTTATYTPSSGYIGSDSFTYTATGPGGTSSAATVSVTVNAPPAPTVGNVSLSTLYNTANTVGLSVSGIYTSLAVANGPAHGGASINGTTAAYAPNSGFYGSDSFTYTATGPGGTSAQATVSVSVQAPPPAPTCTSQTIHITGVPSYASISVNVTSNQILALCSDSAGYTLTPTAPSPLPYSTTIQPNQSSVSIPFTVTDGQGNYVNNTITYTRN